MKPHDHCWHETRSIANRDSPSPDIGEVCCRCRAHSWVPTVRISQPEDHGLYIPWQDLLVRDESRRLIDFEPKDGGR